MKFTSTLINGKLIKRYKRFFVDIEENNKTLTAHCPNTGSMMGLLNKGNTVWFTRNNDPKRKLKFTLEMIKVKKRIIGVNTHRANKIVEHGLKNKLINEFKEINNINVAPSKGNIIRNVNPGDIPYTFSNIYDENKFYPENLAILGEPYILRDVRGQGLVINPLQYNAVTKTLRIYNKIVVKVLEDNNNSLKRNVFSRRKSVQKTTADFKEIYSNLFVNYNSDTRFDYLDDQGGMLIICYDDFIDEMQEFVQWKNKKGIRTEINGVN